MLTISTEWSSTTKHIVDVEQKRFGDRDYVGTGTIKYGGVYTLHQSGIHYLKGYTQYQFCNLVPKLKLLHL